MGGGQAWRPTSSGSGDQGRGRLVGSRGDWRIGLGRITPSSGRGCSTLKKMLSLEEGAITQELQATSQKTYRGLKSMGPSIQCQRSFVTDAKIHCIYIARDEEAVRRQTRSGGFAANKVARVRRMIDPMTAEARGAAGRGGDQRRPAFSPASATKIGGP